jgi:hypothetical protein
MVHLIGGDQSRHFVCAVCCVWVSMSIDNDPGGASRGCGGREGSLVVLVNTYIHVSPPSPPDGMPGRCVWVAWLQYNTIQYNTVLCCTSPWGPCIPSSPTQARYRRSCRRTRRAGASTTWTTCGTASASPPRPYVDVVALCGLFAMFVSIGASVANTITLTLKFVLLCCECLLLEHNPGMRVACLLPPRVPCVMCVAAGHVAVILV